MKKLLINIGVLLGVFVGGLIFFFNITNSESTESSAELENPTLPVMCIDLDGEKCNRMFGYVSEMDPTKLRECLIPLTTDRSIKVSYASYGNKIKSVSYEVYAPDTGETIENGKIGNFKDDGEMKTASFELSEPVLMNQEYPIRFTIKTDEREIYYYARILQRADLTGAKFIEFVNNFYQNCISNEASSDVNAYLETDETVNNTNFANVDIKSSLEMVTWGSLSPRLVRRAVPKIREINSETCTITTDYLISSENKEGNTEYYHVQEYYRLRYYNSKMMLLNFNRKTLQVFDADNGQISVNSIDLGVSTRSAQYMSDDNSKIVAFVQDNALWVYNTPAEKLSCVFTFHSTAEGADERDDNDNYGIKILSTEENGDVDFVVYGYMNRGIREGKTGISLCRYSAERCDVTERAFIEYDGSYEVLKKNVEELSYVNSKDIFFTYLGASIYRVDLSDNSSSVVVDKINPDCLVVSKDNAGVAWMDEMEPCASSSVTLMNLETEETRTIKAGTGEYLKACGFINDDFIYGVAKQDDIQAYRDGSKLFAMYELFITSFDGSEVKEYKPEGLWIKNVTIKEGLIELSRVSFDGTNYIDATTDDIMNNKQTEDTSVTISAKHESRRGTVISLVFPDTVTNITPLASYAKIRTRDIDAAVDTGALTDAPCELYYVYGKGELDAVLTDPAKAVALADENVETAIDSKGRYIFERGNTATKYELANEDIPEGFLTGEINADKLQEALGEDYDVLNLRGCTLKEALYLVSCGSAVAALTADGTVNIIVGYDKYNTKLYNFDTGEHYYYGINDSTALFEGGGNTFVTYVENKNTVKNVS